MLAVTTLLHGVLCAAAISASSFAAYVYYSNEQNEDYEALCDISPQMSCSQVLTSRYSKGFGLVGDILGEDHPLNINNSLYGIVFYCFITLLGLLRSRSLILLVVVGETVGGMDFIYLAYIMRYVLEDFCLVCVSLYVIHGLLLSLHLYLYCTMTSTKRKGD